MFAFIPVDTLELQKNYDPFDYIAEAVLRDGRRWSGHKLKERLFVDPAGLHPESDPANFRPEIESEIDYLVTVPANAQPKDPAVKNIGPWDFGQLDHADRRELRGLGLLAAWLGWFDTRFDNTRLRIVRRGGQTEVVHYLNDLGGVLGETSGLFFSRGEQPNSFPWTFTRPPLEQGPHRLARPLRLQGYKPDARTEPFAAMTIDDARWMGRLIAQLTEKQITEALVGSGCDSATVRFYAEKLICRRDQMVVDLGLKQEFSLLRPSGINRQFSYDPVVEGAVTVDVAGHSRIDAPLGKSRVVKGRLVGGVPSHEGRVQ